MNMFIQVVHRLDTNNAPPLGNCVLRCSTTYIPVGVPVGEGMHLTVLVNISGLSPSPSGRGLGRAKRGAGRFNQTAVYLLKYRMNIIQYLMIPEPDNFITQRLEKQASLYVALYLFQVLPTICFYY